MSGSPAWGIQTAMFGRLSTDATLVTTLSADVYDNIPQGAAFPYVALGDITEVPNDTMGNTGRDFSATVHVWSRYVGMKETKDIQNRVDFLLDRWLPTVAGWNMTPLLHEFFETFREPDGITRHGVSRYRTHAYQ